jgi:hypothetical protein
MRSGRPLAPGGEHHGGGSPQHGYGLDKPGDRVVRQPNQALGVAVLTATSAGVARITVFPGGPALVAGFGLPRTHPGRGR